MIVYSSTKSEFREHVRSNQIEQIILESFVRHLGHSTSRAEIESWSNSMQYMSNVLDEATIPADAGVAIEYRIPRTSKRVDFILTGKSEEDRSTAIIIELKQWSGVRLSPKDAIVHTVVGRTEREMLHPSYQAWTYAALLRDFNEYVQTQEIELRPCAYLHNMKSSEVIKNPHYRAHLKRAPAFLRSDQAELTDFIKQFIRKGDRGRLLFEIEDSRIRPSKSLADELVVMLQGNEVFVMVDDQKIVFETALDLARQATAKEKQVLIVEGGPGTGKSVVAINLLARLTGDRLNTQYVTRNAAPRAVYQAELAGTFKKTHISNLFTGSGSFTDCEPNIFDALIIDEAHRLNEKSGLYQNLGENQIRELVQAAKCSIFFLDEDQRVTWRDIGTAEEIERWARKSGAKVSRLDLQAQFRCNGADGFLSWLDNVLQIRETADHDPSDIDFDFRVCQTPSELLELIEEKNRECNSARAVAGYCWDWVSKKPERAAEYDIVFEDGVRRRWNLVKDGSLWIRMPESVNEIGCIHTCQGLEVDYIGVIVGPDLVVRDGKVLTQPENRSSMDSSIRGYKKALRMDPSTARAKADRIIKNTYRTLLSRGQKGCYVYCTDPETASYFSDMARFMADSSKVEAFEPISPPVPRARHSELPLSELPLSVLPPSEVRPYQNSVPVFDLAVSAGIFTPQNAKDCDWVRLPESFKPREGQFVVRVEGESMNRRIPNGSWCLFQGGVGGSRSGKIVIVELRGGEDPETGGRYTIKRYHSEKVAESDGWRHSRIVLRPESTEPEYSDIVFHGSELDSLRVVGVFIASFA